MFLPVPKNISSYKKQQPTPEKYNTEATPKLREYPIKKPSICYDFAANFSFLISVMANVVVNFIGKWLDKDHAGNEPEE